MSTLVAVLMAPGEPFVDVLRRAWDAGESVLPVDVRLPESAVEELLDELRPEAIVGPDGQRRQRKGGRPTEAGDALVVATSGTTGTPKGVILTHDAVAASAQLTTRRLGVDPARHRWLCCLPVAHVGGLSVICRALLTNTPLEVHPGFDAVAVTAAARNGVTHTSLVTAALRRIDPTIFERILIGGAAAPEDKPANCVQTYGLTETASGIWYDDRPLDGVEVEVRDGEVFVRSPTLLRAYRQRDHDLDPKTADGWFATGDGGSLDNGRLQVTGRRSSMIVTGGENVWPESVEAVLLSHPLVAEVLVRGEPDPEWGHRVIADVVPANGATPTLDAIRDFGRDRLPAYALPRRLNLVAELNRTALGKLRRTAPVESPNS